MEVLAGAVVAGCLVMAWRALAARHPGPGLADPAGLVGKEVVVTVTGGGRIRFGHRCRALVREVDGDWVRFTFYDEPPVPTVATDDGWVHRDRIMALAPA